MKLVTASSGLLISWATVAARRPTEASFSDSSRACWASFLSVMSVHAPTRYIGLPLRFPSSRDHRATVPARPGGGPGTPFRNRFHCARTARPQEAAPAGPLDEPWQENP